MVAPSPAPPPFPCTLFTTLRLLVRPPSFAHCHGWKFQKMDKESELLSRVLYAKILVKVPLRLDVSKFSQEQIHMLSTQFDICPGRMEKVKKTIRKEKKGKKNVFANCGATGSLEIIGPSLHAGPVVFGDVKNKQGCVVKEIRDLDSKDEKKEPVRVKEEVKMFFEAKFKEQEGSAISLDGVPFASIDHNNNYLLVAKFLEEEMRQSIWECDGDKFPGLDDYNFHFIRSCWELLKEDILKGEGAMDANEVDDADDKDGCWVVTATHYQPDKPKPTVNYAIFFLLFIIQCEKPTPFLLPQALQPSHSTTTPHHSLHSHSFPHTVATMLRSLWRSIDRFSFQHFQYVINELQKIKVVDQNNRELVVDLLQSVVEIVTYGYRQDPQIFECFMERQVLADFVRILKISQDSKIEGPLLQYLSIMIQNMDSEHAIFYCVSNGYINNIILHPYKFDGGDLALYYVSFVRAISNKINRDTLCLLVNVQGVISDDLVYQFISISPVSEYFSDLVRRLSDLCFHLDDFVYDKGKKMDTQKRRNGVILESDEIADELYYFKDILSVGEPHLTRLVTENLLNGLVFPLLFSFMASKNKNVRDAKLSCKLVVGGRSMINNVADVILYHILNLNVSIPSEGNPSDVHDDVRTFSKTCSSTRVCNAAPDIRRSGIFAFVFCKDQSILLASIFLLLILTESKDLDCILSPMSGLSEKRYGWLMESHKFHFMFLKFSKESGESHFSLCLCLFQLQTNDTSISKFVDESIFRFMLDGGACKSYSSSIERDLVEIIFSYSLAVVVVVDSNGDDNHGGCGGGHDNCAENDQDACDGNRGDSFIVSSFHRQTSYDQSRVNFLNELGGVWFDHIPDTLITEFASCKRVLEQSSQYKDPLFMLELVLHQQPTNGQTSSYFAWQRMVDAVKAFILHFQLKTFILKGGLVDKPLLNMISSSTSDSRVIRSSDVSSASFGSNVLLESGIPCGIAFSNSEIRDIYVISVASGIIGKLLLVEKHPFRSGHGVVIAIAPLAGLCPKIDEDHPSWLHLQIREFDPQFYSIKTRGNNLSMPDHLADGRWALGLPNARACEEAQLAILNEITKQRSAVEYMLAPLLQDDLE
ncbi:Protein TRANSPARENT TESTA 9 [Glycine soja]